ncbi:MAG: hypothetical protein E3J72_08455 [Planctomycetota bacterium]|nr:MAG: hypothetical protein E3J72_08455 [Planctomycetota bacterium]
MPRLVTLLAFWIIFAPPLEASEWPSLRRGPDGRASVAYNGGDELNEWHYAYKSNRRYKTGLAVWASPALAVIAGRPVAFIGGYDQTMHALDLAEKKAVWLKVTNGEIQSAPAVGRTGGLDVVFWGSADRTVYAHVAYNGRRLWTRELVEASTTLGDVSLSSPLLHDGRLYITCFAYDRSLSRNSQRGWLYSMDMRDGKVFWKIQVSSGFLSSPVGIELDNRFHIAVAARRGILQFFDVSGDVPKKVWDYQMPHEVLGSPVIETNKENPLLFLGSKFGNLVAIDVRTGKEKWKRMAGNWVDNTACIGEIDGRNVVFAGSHDYNVYAFNASDGAFLWKKHLGGEVYSAPCFFHIEGRPYVAAASLDNHLYVLDASNGDVFTSFYTGKPIWDKVSKGETLWGSPAVMEAGGETVLVHGSFNDIVFSLPLLKECSLTALARSPNSLWWTLIAVLLIFLCVVLPLVIRFRTGT